MGRKINDYSFLSAYSFYIPGLGGVVGLLLMFLCGSILGSVANMALMSSFGTDFASEYGMLVAYPLSFVPAMMYASFQSKRNALFDGGYALDSSNFSPLGGTAAALLAVVLTLAGSYICDVAMYFMPQMPQWLETALESVTEGKFWVNFLCVSVMAPVCEEWLCRGMILRGLLCHERSDGRKGYGPLVSIVVSAVIFALIHMNPWQAIPAFLLGCLFGFVYYRTGSLKLTMLMHCVNNSLALILSRIDVFEDADTWVDYLGYARYGAIWVVLTVVVFIILKKFTVIEVKDANGNCDEVIAEIEKKA